jgi:hypothetical protein
MRISLGEAAATNKTLDGFAVYVSYILETGFWFLQKTTPRHDYSGFQMAFAASDMHHDMREIVANDIFDLKDPKPRPSFSI